MEGLLENLTGAMTQLEEGKLELKALESITNDAQELYERLVVLRYQAYEKLQEKNPSDEQPTKDFSFRIDAKDEFLENQTSLIDAIEEASKEPAVETSDPEQSIKTPNIKFKDMPFELEKEVENTAPADADEKPESTQTQVVAKTPKNKEESEDKSLAAKLQKSPIEDLKNAISLNQKFQFISTFFGGNSKTYDAFISEVNDAGDLKKAKKIIQSAIGERDEEDQVTVMFMELVERRYQ